MHTSVQNCLRFKRAVNDAYALYLRGELDESIRRALDAKPQINDPKYLRRLLSNMGMAYFDKGEFDSAVECYAEALELPVDDAEDRFESAVVEGNMANAFVALNRAEESHLFLDRAERVLREAREPVWLGDRLETRARAYLLEGRHKEAIGAAKEAVDLHWCAFNVEALAQSIKTLAVCFEAFERAEMREEAAGTIR
ncbi:MAG TPA: tetratricopeptide repeat protein [Pyrinomonadaceae bacterium]|nr:tetratricopeptide repeat protein [Pyrinomonadaceae bacterium]